MELRNACSYKAGQKTGDLRNQDDVQTVLCGHLRLHGEEEVQYHQIDRATTDTQEARHDPQSQTNTDAPKAIRRTRTIDPNTMALSFSAKERRSTLAAAANIPKEQRTEDQKKLAKIYQDMVAAEESIANSSLIPSRILLWVTTSRNKEGINIKDTDINDSFCGEP